MPFVFTITTLLAGLILLTVGIHRYQVRFLIERWHEDDEELSPIVASPRVSVVVMCQNEGREMEENLPLLFAQQGVDVEVIVVNAASTDTTIDALKRLTLQYPHLRQTYVPTSNTNLNPWEAGCTLGARAARHDWLLFIHSGFTPPSDLWMLDLLRYADSSVRAVVDYGHTNVRSGSEKKFAWQRRQKKMTRTALSGRAIKSAGGSIMIRRSWVLDHHDDGQRRECIYVCRRFNPMQRLILRVQNRRPDFSIPW